jgi:hypothetical protein
MIPVWIYSTGTNFRTVQKPDHKICWSLANENGAADTGTGSRALIAASNAMIWDGENLSWGMGITLDRDTWFSAHFLTSDSSSMRSIRIPGGIGSDGQLSIDAEGGSLCIMDMIRASCRIVRFDTIRYPIAGEVEARLWPVISSSTVESSHASKL